MAGSPVDVAHTKLAPQIKAREFDGSFCFEDYIVRFAACGANQQMVAPKGQALEAAC